MIQSKFGRASTVRYILHLWPLPLLFLIAQITMKLTGNSGFLGLPLRVSGIDLSLFLLFFILAAAWVYWPMSHIIRHQSLGTGQSKLDYAMMTQLPWRALKAYLVTGAIFGTYLMILLLALSEFSGNAPLTLRMVISLVLSVYFSALVLVPALGVAITVHYGLILRLSQTPNTMPVNTHGDWNPVYSLTDSSHRPWLVFMVTGLIPASLLAVFIFLVVGTEGEAEEYFIASQGLVLFTVYILASIWLVFLMSHSLKLVTSELAKGLQHLRHGRFDATVPVLTDDDLGELASGLNTALQGLKEREELKDSLAIAEEIQQGLLSDAPSDIPGYAFCAFEQSCYSVGGDYYDFITLPDGRMWLVIADVAGKGYPAALTVANLQAMLHVLAAENVPFEKAVDYINKALCQTLAGGRFVTLFMAKLQPQSHSLLWLNAGHVPPMLLTKLGVQRLHASTPPLGLLPEIGIEPQRIELQPGDLLLAYTDGVTETHSAKGGDMGGEMFGDQRLADWLITRRGFSPEGLPEDLLRTLKLFGQTTQEDDITLLCVQREGS